MTGGADDKRPFGRQEVMAAVLDAAEELFSQHGVAAVSIREIAAKARVNHGLIYRHFGSKENVRQKVQDRLAARVRADIGPADDIQEAALKALEAVRKNEAYWRVMARTALDGQFKGDLQSEYPFVRKMVELVDQAQKDGLLRNDFDPRILVAGGFAIILGMLLFEDYVMAGAGLDKNSSEDVYRRVWEAWASQLAK